MYPIRYSNNKGTYDPKIDRRFEPVFEWTKICIREALLGRKSDIKEIIRLLNEISSISLFSYLLEKMKCTDVLSSFWKESQRLQNKYSDEKEDKKYFWLINSLFFDKKKETMISKTDRILDEVYNASKYFFIDLHDEELWSSFNDPSDSHLVSNPFNEIELLDHPEGDEFGCPLHILKMPVEKIEEILKIPFQLDKCNWAEINNDSNAEEPELDIRYKKDELVKNLSTYSKAFYHLMVNPNYSFALWSIIPFDESLNVLDSAKRDGKLVMVNSLSKKRWMSIHDLFCEVSFGNNSLADQDEVYNCFHNSCAGNKGEVL